MIPLCALLTTSYILAYPYHFQSLEASSSAHIYTFHFVCSKFSERPRKLPKYLVLDVTENKLLPTLSSYVMYTRIFILLLSFVLAPTASFPL
jgi:hypothetical protein